MIREAFIEATQKVGSAQRLFQNDQTVLAIGSLGQLARGETSDHHSAAPPAPFA